MPETTKPRAAKEDAVPTDSPQQPLPPKSFDPRTFRDRPVSFVRRSGRMTPSQERAWDDLGPRFLLELPRGHAATSIADDAALDVLVRGRAGRTAGQVFAGRCALRRGAAAQ